MGLLNVKWWLEHIFRHYHSPGQMEWLRNGPLKGFWAMIWDGAYELPNQIIEHLDELVYILKNLGG